MKQHSIVADLKNLLLFLLIGAMLTHGSGPVRAAPPGSPWNKDYFTNLELLNHEGKTVRFYDDLIKDKVVAINFIYTDCGDTCPMETANLRRVYKLLADRMGKDIFFYSISIDSAHDKPDVLKEYMKRFKITPDSGWSFLTGNEADITLIRKKLGVFRNGIEAGNLTEHSTSFLIGDDKTGQWIKRSPFDEPKMLAWLLGRSVRVGQTTQKVALKSYDDANQIRHISRGEDLFRSRCDSCHSLDLQDSLGPGLQGVTHRRDKAWLTRWLKTPDQMLSEKDPVAMDLFNRYQRLPMPNLRLSDSEVEALIAYMESQDRPDSTEQEPPSY